jgi:hypothetical protein
VKKEYLVPNPKDIFQTAMPNIIRLQTATEAARLEMTMLMYSSGDTTDAARVHSVPAFLVAQAIEQMETVRQVGKEVEGKERTDMILTVLSAVFAVVPFVGELGAMAAGLATLARIISSARLAANTALTVTDAIEHPQMAPLAIMGLLIGGLPGGRGRPKAPRETIDVSSCASPKTYVRWEARTFEVAHIRPSRNYYRGFDLSWHLGSKPLQFCVHRLMADPQSQPDLSPRLVIAPRRVDDDHAPTISSPLNPDAAARNKQPKPIVREQREKKESLKKRESAAARSSGVGLQQREEPRGASEVPMPTRYTIPTPELSHYNAPKPVVFASHEPNPIFAPDGETELKKSVDQYGDPFSVDPCLQLAVPKIKRASDTTSAWRTPRSHTSNIIANRRLRRTARR